MFQDRYINSTENERKLIREDNPLPKIEEFPEDIQDAIKHKISSEKSLFESQWAENTNQWKMNGDVYKLTKWRHDNDYFSIIQLIKFMVSLEKDFRDENTKNKEEWKNIEIRNANEGLMFYTDEDWNYKRLIKQSFASGESVDVALKKELHNAQWEYLRKNPRENCIWPDSKCKYKKLINPDEKLDDILPEDFNTYLQESNSPLFQAYKDFLQSIQNISDEKLYLLDISDSRQGLKTRRWNILNTSNVFVKEQKDWTFDFTVIDPDVFNKDWKEKFDWKEQSIIQMEKRYEKWNIPNLIFDYIDIFKWKITKIVNIARDWGKNDNLDKSWIEEKISKIAVAPKQEMYMEKILGNSKKKMY